MRDGALEQAEQHATLRFCLSRHSNNGGGEEILSSGEKGLLGRGKTSVQDRRHLFRGAVNQSPFVTKAIGEPDGLCEKFLSSSANRKSARRILPSSRTAPYFWDLFFREKATIQLGFQVHTVYF